MYLSRIWESKALIANHPKIFAHGILLFSVVICFLIAASLKLKSTSTRKAKIEKPGLSFRFPARPPGVWTPVVFLRQAATPYPNWDAQKTEPIPYRPFKYGQYHITMGLRTMKWDEWIELDNKFLEWHAIKAKRIQERGDQCCRTALEAYDGALELLEEL